MALLIGIAVVLMLGVVHHYALANINGAVRRLRPHNAATVLTAFAGLVALHSAEILLLALLNASLLDTSLVTGPATVSAWNWEDVVYLTGINFTTLGFSELKLQGPIRLVTMFQSLGGFMLLTWSATFLYSVCRESWQSDD